MSPFGCPDAQQELADEHERLEIAEDKSMGNLWGGQQSSGVINSLTYSLCHASHAKLLCEQDDKSLHLGDSSQHRKNEHKPYICIHSNFVQGIDFM